jgi:DNA-binding NtrC family response regulator
MPGGYRRRRCKGGQARRMANKVVVVLEDDVDLTRLVEELLEEAEYRVVHVRTVEALLSEAARNSPCVALVDGLSATEIDLWWVGPKLHALGVPPVAFTAHASARAAFEADSHGFVGVVPKPFDADEFLQLVETICWEDHQRAAS